MDFYRDSLYTQPRFGANFGLRAPNSSFKLTMGKRMALDYSEKRDFFRMNLECNMEYSVNGLNKQCGQIKNLSGNGISFLADTELQPGAEIQVIIKPEKSITPPLDVMVEVVRCNNFGDKYEIAGNITRR